jgi:hypothetical protein
MFGENSYYDLSNDKKCLVSKKFGFGESQDFDISQQLRFHNLCMIPSPRHTSQFHARLPNQSFTLNVWWMILLRHLAAQAFSY